MFAQPERIEEPHSGVNPFLFGPSRPFCQPENLRAIHHVLH